MPAGFRDNIRLHRWPGNVRELRNVVARTIALGDLAEFDASPPVEGDLNELFAELLSKDVPFPRARDRLLDEFLRQFVERALDRHDGSVVKASAAVGVSRRYFDRIRERTRKKA